MLLYNGIWSAYWVPGAGYLFHDLHVLKVSYPRYSVTYYIWLLFSQLLHHEKWSKYKSLHHFFPVSNVAVDWSALLVDIREASGPNLGPEIDCAD